MRGLFLILALMLGSVAYHDGAIGLENSKALRQSLAEGYNFGCDIDPEADLVPPFFFAVGAVFFAVLAATKGRRT